MSQAREGGGGLRARFTAAERRAKVKDALRLFKQLVEAGEIPRSDGSPEGESAERKVRQRPDAIRRANMEEPHRKVHTGGRAVVRAAA